MIIRNDETFFSDKKENKQNNRFNYATLLVPHTFQERSL